VVSDGDGILTVVELTTFGSLVTSTYITGANAWSGWALVPGTIAGTGYAFGHVSISGTTYSIEDRLPTLTSWGPGRMELFIFGTNVTTGDGALLHSWAHDQQIGQVGDAGDGDAERRLHASGGRLLGTGA
jgi:hypothetical protein